MKNCNTTPSLPSKDSRLGVVGGARGVGRFAAMEWGLEQHLRVVDFPRSA